MATLNLNKAEFLKSAVSPSGFLAADLPCIVFAGKSNVGKSSVINRLLNRRNFARVGSQPGKTVHVNYFCIDGRAYFVDLPGYGFAKVSQAEKQRWANLISGYFEQERSFNLVVSLVDIRHDAQQLDRDMLGYLEQEGLPFVVALTKADKLSRSKQAQQRQALARQFGLDASRMLVTSSQTGQGIQELRTMIEDACL